MTKKTKTLFTVAAMLLITHLSFAGATEDLWAALKGAKYPEALKAIAAGADVKSLDPAFGTPLNFASCWADPEVIKALLDAKSDVKFVALGNGFTPLTCAASWGNVEAVKLLLAAGSELNVKSKQGVPLFSSGVSSVKLEVLQLLVAAGADPNIKYDLGAVKDLTPLNALIGIYTPKEKVENIKSIGTSLSKNGITFPPRLLNLKESDFTPLDEITKFLIEKGGNPNQKIPGTEWGCILNQAIDLGKTGIAKGLINGKADINFTSDHFENTPLFFACKKGNGDVVQLLTDAKADLNHVTLIKIEKVWMKLTPLMVASAYGFNDCVESLCKGGANINLVSVKVEHTSENSGGQAMYVKTTYKDTALDFADANKHPETVNVLKKHGGLFAKEVKK